MRRKKKDIPEHGGEEKELKREEKRKKMDIDVFYIWKRKRRKNEPGLLWN